MQYIYSKIVCDCTTPIHLGVCFRYYPALKTLEQLEHTYLPRVSNYRFSKVMCDTIPHLRDNIMAASMSDLKDFLENIRKHSDRIGETAMKHVRVFLVIYTIILLKSVCQSAFANCRSRFLLDRLGRCL